MSKRHFLSCGLLLISCWHCAMKAEDLALPEGFSLWQKSFQVGVGSGYKNNVTLSSFAPQGSGFEIASGEVMISRLPWNNWQFSFLAAASDTRYFNSDIGIDTEQNAAASAQLTWFPGGDWRVGSSVQYMYLNQVMDVSATYGTLVRQQVLGHGITWKEGVRKDWGPYWLSLDLGGSRYFFQEPLDDYWQAGPQLTFGRYFGDHSELYLQVQSLPILYDTREQANSVGAPIPGTELRFVPLTAEVGWGRYWDKEHRWRSSTRFIFEWNSDNGSGYYDYLQYRLAEQLRWRYKGWEVQAQVSVAYYDFPNQRASLTDSGSRYRTSLQAQVRVEKTLARHWKLFAAYDYDRSFSNLVFEEYQAHMGSGGVQIMF